MSDSFVVQDREELIYLLCEAAKFEHTVMCTYLDAQWSLVNNLLASIGAVPHLWRPAFPVRLGHFPSEVDNILARQIGRQQQMTGAGTMRN